MKLADMTFEEVLPFLRNGSKAQRSGWNGKGMWIRLVGPYSNTEGEHLPYLQLKTAADEFVPWLASQTDILADDWELVK